MKLGVFDSGIGGVTVLQALRKQFPNDRFAYFGDTAHVPYGTKSAPQIRALSESAARRIHAEGVDALVVACNTASSLALPEIEAVMGNVPVFGMVEAGVKAVTAGAPKVEGPIVVFGTRATIRSGVYGEALRAILPARRIFEQACPLLVPIIEEGWIRHPVLDLTLLEYVGPYLKLDEKPTASGIALLACTHYPWIKEAFQRALPGWSVIDSADAVVERLRAEPRLSANASAAAADGESVEWFFSDPEVAQFIFEGSEKAPTIRTF
jgi:glutamate racemase